MKNSITIKVNSKDSDNSESINIDTGKMVQAHPVPKKNVNRLPPIILKHP